MNVHSFEADHAQVYIQWEAGDEQSVESRSPMDLQPVPSFFMFTCIRMYTRPRMIMKAAECIICTLGETRKERVKVADG